MSKLIKYASDEDRIITETMKEFHENTGLSVDIKLKAYLHRMLATYKGCEIHRKLEETVLNTTPKMVLTTIDTADLIAELKRREQEQNHQQ